jgi:hypothetical protein
MFNKCQEGSNRVEQYLLYQKTFAVIFIYYRILAVLNVETYIIVSLATRPIERVVMQVIIYIETMKAYAAVLSVTSVIMLLTSH